jgi:hypothetical protein
MPAAATAATAAATAALTSRPGYPSASPNSRLGMDGWRPKKIDSTKDASGCSVLSVIIGEPRVGKTLLGLIDEGFGSKSCSPVEERGALEAPVAPRFGRGTGGRDAREDKAIFLRKAELLQPRLQLFFFFDFFQTG